MQRGTSLVELLMALGILAVLGVGFTGVLRMGTRVADDTRSSRALSSLLTQRMEVMRSLSLDAFRALPTRATETVGTRTYDVVVTRTIESVDDPADGVGQGDADPVDYFRVTLSATRADHPTTIETRTADIAPHP